MNLSPGLFKVNEEKSNPMVVAMQYPDCSINEICVYIVIGFGTIAKQCKYFKSDENKPEAECLYENTEKSLPIGRRHFSSMDGNS